MATSRARRRDAGGMCPGEAVRIVQPVPQAQIFSAARTLSTRSSPPCIAHVLDDDGTEFLGCVEVDAEFRERRREARPASRAACATAEQRTQATCERTHGARGRRAREQFVGAGNVRDELLEIGATQVLLPRAQQRNEATAGLCLVDAEFLGELAGSGRPSLCLTCARSGILRQAGCQTSATSATVVSDLRGLTATDSTSIAAGSKSDSSVLHLGFDCGVQRGELLAKCSHVGLGIARRPHVPCRSGRRFAQPFRPC